jgi:hypothetical protein
VIEKKESEKHLDGETKRWREIQRELIKQRATWPANTEIQKETHRQTDRETVRDSTRQ